jgi:hypothetical protein
MHADSTASRIPLASIVLVIEFTQLALIASAHHCLRIMENSPIRSAKARYAIPLRHA